MVVPTRHPGAFKPGSMSDVRRSNLALVLGRIVGKRKSTHLTRADIAAATGLTKASVSSLVLDLLESGLVRETGLNQPGQRGRPGFGLELNPSLAVIGMEINVERIAVAVIDLSGTMLLLRTEERDDRNTERAPVLAALTRLVTDVRASVKEQGMQILGGGLAVAGLVDPVHATVITTPTLGWQYSKLEHAVLLPDVPLGVSLFNGANAAALAEVGQNPGRDSDFLFVLGDVSVGGGLVIGGELLCGPGREGGGLAHIVVDPEGADCSCGGVGCLETVAGQEAIFAAAGIRGHSDPGTKTMMALLLSLASGESDARSAVVRAGHFLGIALASSARIAGTNSVVISGHFAALDRWLRAPLMDSLAHYAPGRFDPSDIRTSAVGDTGAIRGAAGSVIRSVLKAPHLLKT